ncbi:spike base protein, RCAP_Rcc01079 family [Celeribacter neptunius]|uniref:Uncharacterized protein n=1 Tax=Celeribacter neptunius TaxID=588602 RepID=A0A1I3SBM8_9RHOB|nr:hypothetical protein [Celeribacter neptunius]SFJ56125.1 hypothetical protein SAMN04487991_2408 [Celeribacter neptunius]
MPDPFADRQSGLTAPATQLISIVPDDGNDLSTYVRGIAVTSSGLVRVTTVDGSLADIYVAAGAPFPVRVARVWATGTDANGIVGLI